MKYNTCNVSYDRECDAKKRGVYHLEEFVRISEAVSCTFNSLFWGNGLGKGICTKLLYLNEIISPKHDNH